MAKRIFLGALLAGLAVMLLKPLIARQEDEYEKPTLAHATWLEQRWGKFPSGHTAIAFAIATPLANAFPQASLPIYLLAVLVGLARLYRSAHLFSDVVAGAFLGLAIARWVERRSAVSEVRDAPLLMSQSKLQTPVLRTIGMLVALSAPLLFLMLGSWSFGDPDEGRYALISSEMLRSNDFVTPTLNGVPYFEKPPLFYWSVAACFRMFEREEWAARLVPSVSALLGAIVTYLWGRKIFGERAGRWAALMLLTSLIWPVLGRMLIIDMQLSVLMLIAFATWWSVRSNAAKPHVIDVSLFWISIGLACLSKGPVAVVLVLGSIGVYAVLSGEFRLLRNRRWWLGAPLAVAVAAPWFYLIASRHPEFNHFFWYDQHIGRFLGLDKSREHDHPIWYFAVIVPLSLLPWSAFIPIALRDGWRRLWPLATERRRAALYLLVGSATIIGFFSISTCKLSTYTLPAIPLLCLLLAGELDGIVRRGGEVLTRALKWTAVSACAVLLLTATLMITLGPAALMRFEHRAPGQAYSLAAVLVAFAAAVAWVAYRREVRWLVPVLAGGSLSLTVSLVIAMVQLAPQHMIRPLLAKIRPGLSAGAELVSYNGWMPSAGFYLERRLKVFGSLGEMRFGYDTLPPDERRYWHAEKYSVVRNYLAQDRPIYCIVSDHETAQALIKRLGEGYSEVAWNIRRSIIANPAATRMYH